MSQILKRSGGEKTQEGYDQSTKGGHFKWFMPSEYGNVNANYNLSTTFPVRRECECAIEVCE